MKCIWKSCNIKWIAKSITQLECICKQDIQLAAANDDDDDEVVKYIQATGLNLIPVNDDNEATPVPANSDDQEDDVEESNDDQTAGVVPPLPAGNNRTLCGMHQLSTVN